VKFTFDAEVISWRGPSPYFYAPLPVTAAHDIRKAAKLVSYGWGVIPVAASIGGVSFTTSLFPKDGTYLLPLKDAVRRPTGITAGDKIRVELALRPRG
jgi:hypothetical protein